MIWLSSLLLALTLWSRYENSVLAAELLAQARLHISFLVIILILLCLRRKQLLAIMVLVIALTCNAFWIIPEILPQRLAKIENKTISVLTYNTWKNNGTPVDMLDTIKHSDADIIWLQEVDKQRWALVSDALKDTHPHASEYHNKTQSEDKSILFSRYPLKNQNIIAKRIGYANHIIVHTKIITPIEDVEFVGLHLKSPKNNISLTMRNEQVAYTNHYIREHISEDSAFIMAGDMNTAPWRYSFSEFTKERGLHGSFHLPYLPQTWPDMLPSFLRIPIDHIYLNNKLCFNNIETLPSSGSDHIPIFATLHFCR